MLCNMSSWSTMYSVQVFITMYITMQEFNTV